LGDVDAVGPLTVLPPPGGESPLAFDNVAPATRELVDREIRRIVDECHVEAVDTLVAHRQQLDQLAHVLFAKETLDEDDAYAAAGVARDKAPGRLARKEGPVVPPNDSTGMPGAEARIPT
jgi:cell division protease FtsH